MKCQQCVYFLKEFSICTSGFIMYVDPTEDCISAPAEMIEDSPCKQLTPHQFSQLEKTDLDMKWGKDGWLTDVHVRGMPREKAMLLIPHQPISFAFYDQMDFGKFLYSRNPTHPAILVFSPLQNDTEYKVYKQWNAGVFPPSVDSGRLPAQALPAHLEHFYQIARLMHHRQKENSTNTFNPQEGIFVSEFLTMDIDVEKTLRLWQSYGYQGGYVQVEGRPVAYFAYKARHTNIAVFDSSNLAPDVSAYDLGRQITFHAVEEAEPLEKLNLSAHCLLCGLENPTPFDITYPCHFCLRKVSRLAFNPTKEKPIK